jgi:hypothetical protein
MVWAIVVELVAHCVNDCLLQASVRSSVGGGRQANRDDFVVDSLPVEIGQVCELTFVRFVDDKDMRFFRRLSFKVQLVRDPLVPIQLTFVAKLDELLVSSEVRFFESFVPKSNIDRRVGHSQEKVSNRGVNS